VIKYPEDIENKDAEGSSCNNTDSEVSYDGATYKSRQEQAKTGHNGIKLWIPNFKI
jgi:hypothetical protein